MRILLFLFCFFLLLPISYAKSGSTANTQSESSVKTQPIPGWDVAKINQADAAMANLKLIRKGGNISCFDECLAKDTCGKRPPNPSGFEDTVGHVQIMTWATCVLAEMTGCRIGCKTAPPQNKLPG
jgi:hypothetical protein